MCDPRLEVPSDSSLSIELRIVRREFSRDSFREREPEPIAARDTRADSVEVGVEQLERWLWVKMSPLRRSDPASGDVRPNLRYGVYKGDLNPVVRFERIYSEWTMNLLTRPFVSTWTAEVYSGEEAVIEKMGREESAEEGVLFERIGRNQAGFGSLKKKVREPNYLLF